MKDTNFEVKIDVANLRPKQCVRCGEPATLQTTDGKYQESIGALPQNHDWYCEKCADEGERYEYEAMYNS